MGVRRCLARSLTGLASRCALQRVQTVPAAIHSGRISPPRPTSPRGRKTQPSPSPHRTWSVPDASSKPQLNLHLRLETISGRSGPGPVCKNLRLSLPSPAITWTGEVGGINCGGDMGVRRCLARSLTSLALPRTPKSANGPRSNSFRPDSPSTTNFPRGRKTQPSPHHTGHGPFRTRPPTSVKSPYCLIKR